MGVQFARGGDLSWQGWRLTAFIDLPWITWLLSVVDRGVDQFIQHAGQHGRLVGGRGRDCGGMLAAVLLLTSDPQTRQPQIFVAGFLLVLVGSLWGSVSRCRRGIFMGDAGSYFVGFCIAVATLLATFTGYQGTHQHAVLAPLCVMAVPLYDMITSGFGFGCVKGAARSKQTRTTFRTDWLTWVSPRGRLC